MNIQRRGFFPSILFAGLQGHIFVTVPLLLYVLSTIDGRIVFYVLLISFQLYVCILIGLALFIHEEIVSSLVIRLMRLSSAFCWGGICFMVYALIGSVVYARIQREPSRPKAPPAVAVASTADLCSAAFLPGPHRRLS